jgi:hypothetical protein
MDDSLKSIIENSETIVDSNESNVKAKLEAINTIIQIKLTYDKKLYYNELYRDVKKMIAFYIEAIDERKYEYDIVNKDYIESNLAIFETKERIALYNFLIRKLKIHGLDHEVEDFLFFKRKSELKLLIKTFPKSSLTLISKLITYNLWSIALTILISYLIYFIVLLPSFTGIELFKINYKRISGNFYLNHLCNTLLAIFDVGSEEFIHPLNLFGVILIVLGKLVFIILILKVCIDKFVEHFKSSF